MISRGYRISKTCSHLGTTSVGRPGVYIERMGPRKSVDEKPKFPQKDFLQAKQAVKMSSLSVSCTNKISDAKLCKRNAVLRMNWLNSRLLCFDTLRIRRFFSQIFRKRGARKNFQQCKRMHKERKKSAKKSRCYRMNCQTPDERLCTHVRN